RNDFFFSSRRRHTIFSRDWSSDVCSSDLPESFPEQRRSPRGSVPHTGECMSSTDRTVRVASGQGFWGDDLEAPVRQVEQGPIDRSEERRVGKEGRTQWSR